MHRLTLFGLLVLAACASPRPTPYSYRDAAFGLYSNASFDPARLDGEWRQAASFAPYSNTPCTRGAVRIAPWGDGSTSKRMQAELCLGGERAMFNGRAEFTAVGRLRLSGGDPQMIGLEWWVLWVDTDYRTMAIGTPSGRFGFILNRTGSLPADRLTAARELFDFNGYDLEKLFVFKS